VQPSKSCSLQRRGCRFWDPPAGALLGPGDESPGRGCSVPARPLGSHSSPKQQPPVPGAPLRISSRPFGFGRAILTSLKATGHPTLTRLQPRFPGRGTFSPLSPLRERPPRLGLRSSGDRRFAAALALLLLYFWGERRKRWEASNFQSCQNDASYEHEKISAKS